MPAIAIEILNTTNGFAGTIIDKLVDHLSRERARGSDFATAENVRQETAQRKLEETKHLMAGIYVAASHHDLGAIALNKVLELKEVQDTAAAAAVQRKTNEQRQLELEVENMREKGNDPASWNSKELKTMVKWFKRPADAPLPNWKGELLRRYEATKTCNEQDRTYLKDGEHAVLHNNALEEEAAAGGGRETTMGEGGEAAAVCGV